MERAAKQRLPMGTLHSKLQGPRPQRLSRKLFPRCLHWPCRLILSPDPTLTHTSAHGAWEQTASTYSGSTDVPTSSSNVLRGPRSQLHNWDSFLFFILTMIKQQQQTKRSDTCWHKSPGVANSQAFPHPIVLNRPLLLRADF